MQTVRLVHFSDIHLTAKPLGWRPRDWFTKRVTGWLNLRVMGRGRRFHDAPTVIAALLRAIREQPPHAIIFSGDATHLGFESEVTAAVAALSVHDDTLPPGFAVPGNHDYYTKRAVVEASFERHFAPWQQGLRIDDHPYPFARQVGHVWLVGVCSSTANRWRGDASGEIGLAQLTRLKQLCAQLGPGPRVLVTHYPLRTAEGRIEPRVHRLRDHIAALDTAKDCGISLWLHGHIHKAFFLKPTSEIPFPVICAGSATQNNRWEYFEYEITDHHVAVTGRVYDPKRDAFRDSETFAFNLPRN